MQKFWKIKNFALEEGCCFSFETIVESLKNELAEPEKFNVSNKVIITEGTWIDSARQVNLKLNWLLLIRYKSWKLLFLWFCLPNLTLYLPLSKYPTQIHFKELAQFFFFNLPLCLPFSKLSSSVGSTNSTWRNSKIYFLSSFSDDIFKTTAVIVFAAHTYINTDFLIHLIRKYTDKDPQSKKSKILSFYVFLGTTH